MKLMILILSLAWMSPVLPVFHTLVTVRICLNNIFRVGTSILKYRIQDCFPMISLWYNFTSLSSSNVIFFWFRIHIPANNFFGFAHACQKHPYWFVSQSFCFKHLNTGQSKRNAGILIITVKQFGFEQKVCVEGWVYFHLAKATFGKPIT